MVGAVRRQAKDTRTEEAAAKATERSHGLRVAGVMGGYVVPSMQSRAVLKGLEWRSHLNWPVLGIFLVGAWYGTLVCGKKRGALLLKPHLCALEGPTSP